jgi:hypothetical protein
VKVDDDTVTYLGADDLRTNGFDDTNAAMTQNGGLIDGDARQQDLVDARVAGLSCFLPHQYLTPGQRAHRELLDRRRIVAVFDEGPELPSALGVGGNRRRTSLSGQVAGTKERGRSTA